MNKLEQKQLVGKLLRANRLHKSLADKKFSDPVVHRNQRHIMLYLMESPEPPSQKEIAAAFEISTAAITMSLKKMEQNGLIERVSPDEDNRVKLISISDKGREYMLKNKEYFDEMDEAMLDGVSEEDLATVSGVLDKFIENLLKIGAEDMEPNFMKQKRKELIEKQ